MEQESHVMKATELRLGLPGSDEPVKKSNNKRASSEMNNNLSNAEKEDHQESPVPPTKTQVVGWPPVRAYRKNVLRQKKTEADSSGMYVKVSMDGAPFLRKIDLKVYNNYTELLKAFENMFKCTIGVYCEKEGYNGSEDALTYEDKDGDWMLAGDVPWEMFIGSCRRMRIMKASEAKGLGCL
ncbi:hypothetical protein DCAR_0102814 [Daucus carota subsp. sativus]|uniref:Auxin-responsive protein n=1 Tax=Daucus carota subsp. sativus TaxID=79200 RepID=A0AAF0W5Z7_DAUCS|nr:PREDICTED: auxin-induced protein 22D-like [Daucus carota subsp. sativus]WOG83637.1 hypothetical protein DCAR_0102814 [Daucus carota subsp. sativus]